MQQQLLSDAFLGLVKIMDELRAQCPWDKKQTIHTLRTLTIEETYELTDAITNNDWQGIKEELGDIMLHLLFYAKIGNEEQQFTLEDVLTTVSKKLIERHPHIYGDTKVQDEEEVKRNWEKIKKKEGRVSVLGGVPTSLPALVKATRIQEKAKQVGFEWEQKEAVWAKVEEELGELQVAVNTGNINEMEDEFGDVLFSLVNYARFIKVDPENALERTNLKFKNRFQAMEQLCISRGIDIATLNLTALDNLWNEVKKNGSAH